MPPEYIPIEEWLRPQGRFKHLLEHEHRDELEKIQRQVDTERDALLARCER